MMKIRKDSNLSFLGRFGIGPLVVGAIVTPMAALLVWQKPSSGDAWLVLALAATFLACGLGAIIRGFWLDLKPNSRDAVSHD